MLDPTSPIEELQLDARPLNALKREGITTVGHLSQLTISELDKIPFIGSRSIADIKNCLEIYAGIKLRKTRFRYVLEEDEVKQILQAFYSLQDGLNILLLAHTRYNENS